MPDPDWLIENLTRWTTEGKGVEPLLVRELLEASFQAGRDSVAFETLHKARDPLKIRENVAVTYDEESGSFLVAPIKGGATFEPFEVSAPTKTDADMIAVEILADTLEQQLQARETSKERSK